MMSQPVIQLEDRDFKLTPSGDLSMTQTIDDDKAQNAAGNTIVIEGNDIFDIIYGIDWGFIARLGSGDAGKSYIKSVIREKFEDEDLEVIDIEIKAAAFPMYSINITYSDRANNTQNIPLNFTI